MKRSLLLSLLSVVFIHMSAITVEELFNKYKDMEDAQYTLIDKDQLNNQIDSVESDSDKRILAALNKMEILMVMLDENQRQQLAEDLNALQDYSLEESFTHNEPQEEFIPGLKSMFDNALNPSLNADIYSRDVVCDSLVQPLIVLDLMDFTSICFIDGNMPLEDVKSSISFSVNYDRDDDQDLNEEEDDDGDAIEMSYYSELIKRGEYLIAIDGILMPDIKTQERAAAYMCDHGISICRQELIPGRENVKKFFPDADAEIVLNYVTVIE